MVSRIKKGAPAIDLRSVDAEGQVYHKSKSNVVALRGNRRSGAWKSFTTVLVWLLVLPVAMGVVLYGSVEQVNAADFHVTTAAEFRAALDAAENNAEDDVLYLAAGIYQGNFNYQPPNTEHKSLSVKGKPGTSAEDIVLDGQDSGKVLYLTDNVVEDGGGPVAEI